MQVFDNTAPEGRSYLEHLNVHFREFVRAAGGGSRVVRCHSSLEPLFKFIGITPKVDDSLPSAEARVGGMKIRVDNLDS